MAAKFAVGRSAQLNFEAAGRRFDPRSFAVHEHANRQFLTQRVVIDLRGGEPLPAWRRSAETVAPGEVLLLDDTGRLVVRSELEDFDEVYLHETPPKPKKPLDKVGEPRKFEFGR